MPSDSYVTLLLLSVSCAVVARQPRVDPGAADWDEFSFTVGLQQTYHPFTIICTGSLLSRTWVLTAGHCLSQSFLVGIPLFLQAIRIRYAEFNVTANETESFVNITGLFMHPSYSELYNKIRNDIALMLTDEVPTKAVAKLSAIDYNALIGLPIKYAVFDRTKEDQALQSGEAAIVPCDSTAISYFWPVICVAAKCSDMLHSSRPKNSGAPLIFRGKIIGVYSSTSDPRVNVWSVTPVSPYLKWIADVMNNGHAHTLYKKPLNK